MYEEVSSSKKKWLIATIVILSILLIAGILVIARQISSAKKDVDSMQDLSTATATASASVTAQISATASATTLATATTSATSAAAEQANAAVTNFMQAKRDRSLGEAKQYMTDELYKNTDQIAFAGASSPSMSRFEIVSNTVKDAQTFRIVVKSYWLLQGEDAGTINYTIEAMKIGNSYLVNRFDQN
jgi:flagellar basal body-associated protein FliL